MRRKNSRKKMTDKNYGNSLLQESIKNWLMEIQENDIH